MNTTTLNWNTVRNYVVIGGSAILAVSSVAQLIKTPIGKGSILPVAFLLTGIAAFSVAWSAKDSSPVVATA